MGGGGREGDARHELGPGCAHVELLLQTLRYDPK